MLLHRARCCVAFLFFCFQTGSDCEVIIPLYLKYGTECVSHLRGQFAFVLVDLRDDSFLISRDPIGINPLYWVRACRLFVVVVRCSCVHVFMCSCE